MTIEVIKIHGIPVPMFIPDNLPKLPNGRRVDQEFDTYEGKQEAGKFGKKPIKQDDREG